MFMKIKPLLVLAWSLSLVEANYFTDIVGYSEVPETGKEIDYNFGSLRMAVLIHADEEQDCGDEDLFSDEFYDGLTHAISLAIDVEQADGPGGDDHRHIFFPPKLWKNILHREKKHVNGGIIWEHSLGKHKKMNRDRELLFGYGATEPPEMEPALDPFCHHMHGAAPRDRYVECSCTGDYCHETVAERRRRLGKPRQVVEDEVEEVVIEEHEADEGHRELTKERSVILNLFEKNYNIPLLSFSWMGHKAAVDYIKEVLADREITPACFSMEKDPIVLIGMTLFYTKE